MLHIISRKEVFFMQHIHKYSYIQSERPALLGTIRGGLGHENISGTAAVFWQPDGVYFEAQLYGLPESEVLGLHIHDGFVCGEESGFAQAGEHFSLCPEGTWCSQHPYHAGDLPPVFSDGEGNAVLGVYLDKVLVSDITGRTLILHSGRDDFKTQPAGGAGVRIACGVLAENL